MNDQIISQEGYEKLQRELEEALERRKEIAERIERAKEMGDLSENAEYQEAKDAQAFNEGRVVELKTLLKSVTIVDKTVDHDSVGLGSKITARTEQKTKEFTLVSFNEVDPLEGKISNESPLGIAFIGKRVGDKVVVNTPKGEVQYEIVSIE